MMKNNIILFLNKFNKSILICIGIIMFITYIWYRFIREKLPKNIPFELTELGFISILYIICIYMFIIYTFIKIVLSEHYEFTIKETHNWFFEKLIEYIVFPLKTFDLYLKEDSFLRHYYMRVLAFIINRLKLFNTFYKAEAYFPAYNNIYFMFQIYPRLILIIALFIDTFFFHSLFLIYKVILVGLIPLIYRYIKYSLRFVQEEYIISVKYMINNINCIPLPNTELYNPFIVKEIFLRTTIDDFIHMQVNNICYLQHGEVYVHHVHLQNDENVYYIYLSDNYIKDLLIQNNIKIDADYLKLYYLLPKEKINDHEKVAIDTLEKAIIPIAVILEEFNFCAYKKDVLFLRIIIFFIHLICWMYILWISIDSINSLNSLYYLLEKQDPFSLTDLFI